MSGGADKEDNPVEIGAEPPFVPPTLNELYEATLSHVSTLEEQLVEVPGATL